jgi:hypothetical protein
MTLGRGGAGGHGGEAADRRWKTHLTGGPHPLVTGREGKGSWADGMKLG